MSEGNQTPKRYKPGLDIQPHKLKQLRWAAHRIPWLVVGTLVGALFVPSYPDQTKQQALLALAVFVGGGLIGGLVMGWVAPRWLFPDDPN